MALLYSDEDFPHPVVDKLRLLGHDVLTAEDAGQANQKLPDDTQLAYATSLLRGILSHNRRDFIRLHRASTQHAGIIVCTRDPATDALAQRIHEALEKTPDLRGQLIRIYRM